MTTCLALGAWLKNRACLWNGHATHWSVPHGDLSQPQACEALDRSVETLLADARSRGEAVAAVAHDLHPDFYSTRLAQTVAARLAVPAVAVQHHHAHVAVALAEHGLDGPAVGLALDGVGLGHDGQAWGGELLHVGPAAWRRLGHLRPLALAGGDRAAREPWRMAAAVLQAAGRGGEIVPRFAPRVGQAAAAGVADLLARGVRCPPTSSTGRWFDAAAAMLGLCDRQADEAEAAIALQQAAQRHQAARGAAPVLASGWRIDAAGRLDLLPLLLRLLAGRDAGEPADAAAAVFHATLAEALVQWAGDAAARSGVRLAVLSGGCFFNELLRDRVSAGLAARGLQVLWPRDSGPGDAGLALGQAWVVRHALVAGAHPLSPALSPVSGGEGGSPLPLAGEGLGESAGIS